jgi:hypothetical protein
VKPISSPNTDVNPIGKEHESRGQHEEGGIDPYLSPVRFGSGYRMSGHRFGRYLTRSGRRNYVFFTEVLPLIRLLEKLPSVEDGIMRNRLPENWLGSNTELRLLGEQESRSIRITPHGFPDSC